jgi:predicted nucleotidyltransferase component of viral defense system
LIPLREIAAWREFAPWPSDTQVEQDLLLTRAMAGIFADDFLRDQVAMRGGTALHKVHLAPAARYSEDIDLVQIGERPSTHVEKALKRVLEPLLGRPRLSMVAEVALAVRNWVMPSRILRLEYAYRPTTAPQAQTSVKIEVNYTERRPFYAIVGLPYAPPIPGAPQGLMLRSYDIDEMLGTKMRALLQRDQGRDLFDAKRRGRRAATGRPGPRGCRLQRLHGAREHGRAPRGIRREAGQEAGPQGLPQRHGRHAQGRPAAL